MFSYLHNRLKLNTERLQVESWSNYASMRNETDLAERIISILTPEVTQSLPTGWHRIETIEEAKKWIIERENESAVFAIEYAPKGKLVGFLFLGGEPSSDPNLIDLRLGYLLAEEFWGTGLGSELIKGLVSWCEKQNEILSISGGVEANNKSSIRVLEKNGFRVVQQDNSPDGVIFLERKFKAQPFKESL